MRIEKLTGYASLAIVFTIISISLGSAQNNIVGSSRFEPLSKFAHCFMITIYFSAFFSLLLLMECFITLFLRRMWKYPSTISFHAWERCEKSFTANVTSFADANNLGPESMKPIVAVMALLIWFVYDMSKLDSIYQVCIIGTAALISMNLFFGSTTYRMTTMSPVVAIRCVDRYISVIEN